jgi:hypothetical protein
MTAASAIVLPGVAGAVSTTVNVPGTSNPFLAGQPTGTGCCGGDSAPAESPVLATTALTGGQVLTFSATGGVLFEPGTPDTSADGDNNGTNYTYRFSMTADYGTGIAGANNVNVDGLVGVFVDGTPSSAAPTPLDFAGSGGSTGLDFASLAPGLDQIFWIGDGLTGIGSGAVQKFIVPTGATALYLGTVDGFGWNNNVGTIVATINGVPEPASWATMILGIGAMGAVIRNRRGPRVA